MPLETSISREIKLLAEVEKIWIIFDVDKDGLLDIREIADYIDSMTVPKLEMTNEQMTEVFNVIDTDGDGYIDKNEMQSFLKVVMVVQQNLQFKTSDHYMAKRRSEQRRSTKEKRNRHN